MTQEGSSQHSINPRTITYVLAALYILLSLIHFFYQRPLWNDETCVLQSIKAFNARQMFSLPLLNDQVFPRVYLYSIQHFSRLFDYHLLSLRLPSMLCMLAGFFIWLRISAYELKDRFLFWGFILSWSASAPLLYYAAELKPYSLDVLAASLFLLFLYHQKKIEQGPPGVYGWLLMSLPFLGFVSYPAFLFLIFPFYNLLSSFLRDPRKWRFLLAYCLSAGMVIGMSYFFDMRYRNVEVVTVGFKDYFISFHSIGDFLRTLGDGTFNLIGRFHVERPRVLKVIALSFTPIGLIFMIYAFIQEWRKERFFSSLNSVALILYCELFLLGALKVYPFTIPRVSLFFAPVVHYLTIRGIAELKKIHPVLFKIVFTPYIVFLIVLALGLVRIVLKGQMHFQPALW